MRRRIVTTVSATLLLLGALLSSGCDLEPSCADRYSECSNECRSGGTPIEQQACVFQCENEFAGCRD